jgi:hypothetical protein
VLTSQKSISLSQLSWLLPAIKAVIISDVRQKPTLGDVLLRKNIVAVEIIVSNAPVIHIRSSAHASTMQEIRTIAVVTIRRSLGRFLWGSMPVIRPDGALPPVQFSLRLSSVEVQLSLN